MRKVFIFLLAGVVCAGVATASFSYTVSGKVYYLGTGTIASNATVTFEVEWVPNSGVWSGSSVFTALDGSFSFSINSDTDPKNKNMKLKATKGVYAGSTAWVCASYSETKDVWISSTVALNPHLSVAVNPGIFYDIGPQIELTTTASLDGTPTMPVEVYEFRTVVSYDPEKMGCSIGPSPDSFFDVFVEISAPGMVTVHGYSRGGMPIPLMPGMPQSFFDVFFDVFTTDPPSYTPVVVEDMTMLYTTSGIQSPYPTHTEILLGKPEKCKATFLISGYDGWEKALDAQRPYANIRPVSMTRWEQYMTYWHSSSGTEKQGLPYPETTFVPCVDLDGVGDPDGMLYALADGGGGGGGVSGPGLVMAWKYDPTVLEGNYASAWEYDYGQDPDLTNCTIQVTVTPPAPPVGVQSQITAVSFSIIDITGKLRTWWWSVPAAIPLGVPTTVKINTAIAGIGAATPAATGYLNVLGFDITKSQFFDVDENFQYRFGQLPVPPPGQQKPLWGWNYWHNLTVTKNTAAHKGIYIKYSQKPEVLDAGQPPLINGWDEQSVYTPQPNPIMADDWPCYDSRPITDIHWWGSFIGWTQPYLPPVLPKGFHIGIWTDVPQNPNNPFSHPGTLLWEYRGTCTSWVWNFAGYDKDPRLTGGIENEACFQFTQLLSEDEWFFQEPNKDPNIPNIYWLSIAAIYNPGDEQLPEFHPWGWKTRPHQFNDDAVRIQHASIWPPTIGSVFSLGMPVELQGVSWDLAFELTTNEPKAPASADLNYDGIVNLADFAIFAQQWLSAGV
jgi:hypothetical protein